MVISVAALRKGNPIMLMSCFLKKDGSIFNPVLSRWYARAHPSGLRPFIFCINGETAFEHFISRAKKTNVQRKGPNTKWCLLHTHKRRRLEATKKTLRRFKWEQVIQSINWPYNWNYQSFFVLFKEAGLCVQHFKIQYVKEKRGRRVPIICHQDWKTLRKHNLPPSYHMPCSGKLGWRGVKVGKKRATNICTFWGKKKSCVTYCPKGYNTKETVSIILKSQASARWQKISTEHTWFTISLLENRIRGQAVWWYLWHMENLRSYILVALNVAKGTPSHTFLQAYDLQSADLFGLLQKPQSVMSITWNFISAKVPR